MAISLYNKIRHNIIEKTNPYIGGLRVSGHFRPYCVPNI